MASLFIPDRLLKSFIDEGVVAFVGAGISVNAGMPNWSELMDSLFEETKEDLSDPEIKSVANHLQEKDYLLVADFLKSKLGLTRYKAFIERIFNTQKEGMIHKLIVSIPFSGIVTTNYDNILSQSDQSKKFGFPFTWEDNEIFKKTKKSFILHAHGLITSPGSTILSTSDYDDLSHTNSNIKFWEAIKNIFQNHRVIFLGYSLNDPDFNLFLTKLKYIFPDNLNEHFALLVNGENDPLNIYRLKEILGITPIFVNSDALSETTFNWLSKFKKEINSIQKNNDEAKFPKHDNVSKDVLYNFNSLKDSLNEYLTLKYPTRASLIEIVNDFDNANVLINQNNIIETWAMFIAELQSDILRKFVLYLIAIDTNSALLKRLLSHLPKG